MYNSKNVEIMTASSWYMRLGKDTNADPGVFVQEANELQHCTYGFLQAIDEVGIINSEVHINPIEIAFSGLPSNNIIEWAMSSASYLSGMMVYFGPDGTPMKKVHFEDGACVGMTIDYDEGGSILTTLCIHPKKLSMPDTGNFVTENWSTNILNLSKDSQTRSEGFRSHAGVTTMIADFDAIREKDNLDILHFRIQFKQNVNFRGKPCSNTYGGLINFSIGSVPNDALEQWMVKSNMKKDGKFIFYRENEGSPLIIHFEKAHCTSMKSSSNYGTVQTDFVLSAAVVKLNETPLYNNFNL